jgi:hypothetical protein
VKIARAAHGAAQVCAGRRNGNEVQQLALGRLVSHTVVKKAHQSHAQVRLTCQLNSKRQEAGERDDD